jgi:serine/threonine protein kinase
MKCPECGVENPDGTQFCSNCAGPLIPGGLGPQEPTRTYMAPVLELAPGSTFARRYRIIEELERGGMGRIYKVLDTEVDERVVLKLIKPEIAADAKTIERFRRELKYARKIGHRNVCRMYDLGREGQNFFITMEYIAGEDLKSFIKRSGRLTVAKAVSLAKQVCGGLSEAHRLGVIHRDLKPKNIMIDTDGNARILDFGIARSLQAEDITRDGAIVGTPEYMSPEQVETKDIDKRSDIYSLGIILFEMLTGRTPFEGETPLSVAMKHKTEKPPDPQKINPQIPAPLNRVILKCLEKKREQRYQTIEEVLTELSAIENELPTTDTIVPRRKTRITDEITVTIGLKKLLIPIFGLIAIGILALFIFNPFSKKATIPVPTDRPSLAVMYFKNNTGDESFDHWRSALSDLLITDLSQSPNIRVLSAERLFNILSQLDQVEATAYSSEVIREVGERGGISSVLVGNYTKANGTFRINASLQDARTGELVASEQLEGEGEKSFYDMVDELTRRVKENFVFTDEEIAKDIDKDVTAITTSSPEAFRHYSEGRRLHLIGHYPQSISEIQAALEIDPDFAMAYRSMASTYANMGFRPASIEALQKAFELSYRTSDRERYIIAGDYYRIQESTFGQAIDAYNQLLELYPEDTTGSTNLGLVYGEIEEFEKAAELYRTNILNQTEGWISRWNLTETYGALR